MLLLLSLACVPTDWAEESPPFSGDTRITSVDWGCSADADTWTFDVSTEGWTAGGLLSMSTDGLRVEAHEVLSKAAAPDGSSDQLELKLNIIADPREVEEGETTAFVCEAPTRAALAYRLVVYDGDTREVADCRVWGQELDWNAAAGYSACDTRLE